MRRAYLSLKILVITLTLSLISGCAVVYKPLGWTISAFSKDEVVSYVLTQPDVDVAICGTGPGLTQLVASLGNVVKDPSYVLFYTDLLTGFCAEAQAYEADLRHIRASHQNQVAIAKDELIASRRWHAIAAERRMKAVAHLTNRYGSLDNDYCPRLFNTNEELAYLLGLTTALQAVRSDLLSGAQVGVPRDLAVQAMRASLCLDNEKWWGTPAAIRSTVWAFVPGAAPKGANIWRSYKEATDLAQQSSALYPVVLHALGAENQGNEKEMRDALRLAAKIQSSAVEFPPEYALVNTISAAQIEFLSDTIWMRLTGSRTPAAALGTFPDERQQREVNLDGLL
ncbi:MAG TPA: hypothetical protein VK099_02730 [Alcanivoracaceae bacterium]|nr:hypothetical protein [Alcanivoracaceae bacterium]